MRAQLFIQSIPHTQRHSTTAASNHTAMLARTLLGCAARFSSASPCQQQLLPAALLGASPARGYHENVVDHYENPRNIGSFKRTDENVGTGLVGAPACGDVMKLQIKVDENGFITDSCFKTFGCGSAIASSSVATEWIKGKAIEEVVKIKNSEIAKHLSLPPVKLHCSMLAEDAIKAAVKDIQEKRAAAKAAAGKAGAGEAAAKVASASG